MNIKIFEGNYNTNEFYKVMGKYFAEQPYKKEMPYMVNRETNVWFLALEGKTVIGFGAVNILKNKVILEHSYVEKEYREKGVWKLINDARLSYAKCLCLPLEVITKEQHLQKYWKEQGFAEFKKNGSYTYFRKEAESCIII